MIINDQDEQKIIPEINVLFVNGKIVREGGYWDISKLMLDMQSMQDTTKNK